MTFFFISWLGCMKNPIPPYPIDEDLDVLQEQCTSSDLDYCTQVEKIKKQTQKMISLHKKQMEEFEVPLQKFFDLLSVQENLPIAYIVSEEPDISTWNDVQGEYPVELIARLQYKRGLERLTDDKGELFQQLVSELQFESNRIRMEWQKAMKVLPVKLPKELLLERQPIETSIKTLESSVEFSIPYKFEPILPKEYKQWKGIASHVAYQKDGRDFIINENTFNVNGAFKVVYSDRKSKTDKPTLTITEAKKELQYVSFVTQVPLLKFCENIRSELRFVYGDDILRKKAVFVKP